MILRLPDDELEHFLFIEHRQRNPHEYTTFGKTFGFCNKSNIFGFTSCYFAVS